MVELFVPMPLQIEGHAAQYFITGVKLAPGQTPIGLMKAIDRADQKLPGGTRHNRGIHEEHSFVTLGRYDLVVIWRAPDLTTMGKYIQEIVEVCGREIGSTETLVATHKGEP